MTVIAFSGSRDFSDGPLVVGILRQLRHENRWRSEPITVHVGDARGLDRIVSEACERLGIPCVVHVADWEHEGKSAGFKRNARIIASGPFRLVAFYGPNGRTKGTSHTIDLAIRAGIPVEVYHQDMGVWEFMVPMGKLAG